MSDDDLFPNSDDLFPETQGGDFLSMIGSSPASTGNEESDFNQFNNQSADMTVKQKSTSTPPPQQQFSYQPQQQEISNVAFSHPQQQQSRSTPTVETNGFLNELQSSSTISNWSSQPTTTTTTTTQSNVINQWNSQPSIVNTQQQQQEEETLSFDDNPFMRELSNSFESSHLHQPQQQPQQQLHFQPPPQHTTTRVSNTPPPVVSHTTTNTWQPQQQQPQQTVELRAKSPHQSSFQPAHPQQQQERRWSPPNTTPPQQFNPTQSNQWFQPSTTHQQPPQQPSWQSPSPQQQDRWTPSPSLHNQQQQQHIPPANQWQPNAVQNNWQPQQHAQIQPTWSAQPPHFQQQHRGDDFFGQEQQQQQQQQQHGFGWQQHQMPQQRPQYQFQPPPPIPIFSFGFGKSVFISAKSTQVTVFPGLTAVVNNKPDIVSALDVDDANSKNNYLNFTLNGLLSNASKEKWELWQIVQLFARYGADQQALREQIAQFLIGNADPIAQTQQFQVIYNEAAVLPHLERGDVRAAIDEAMNNRMYGLAVLLSQGWPELNLQQQVLQAIANTTSPTLSALLGFNNNNYSNTDWRRTVGLILRNDSKANGVSVIQSLGDWLWKDQKNVFSAHLCYLCCGLLMKNEVLTQRTILLGGDHKRNMRGFFDKETIERSLFIPDLVNSPKFQPFKLLYALYLVTYCGNYELAQKYLASIPKDMLYNSQFKYQYEMLSHRLKAITNKSSGFFGGSGTRASGVTGWFIKSFESLIHGDDSSPVSDTVSSIAMPGPTSTVPPQQQPSIILQPPVATHITPPPLQQQPPQQQPPKRETPKQDSGKSGSGSGSGFFASIFGKKKNEVSLGRDLEMEFCQVRKRWVPKGQAGMVSEDEKQEEQNNAPPDMAMMGMMMNGGASFLDQPSISQRGGYVDLFNSSGSGGNLTAPPPMGLPKNRSSPNLASSRPASTGPPKFFMPSPAISSSVSEPSSPAFQPPSFNAYNPNGMPPSDSFQNGPPPLDHSTTPDPNNAPRIGMHTRSYSLPQYPVENGNGFQ
jgi:hypothetical protein